MTRYHLSDVWGAEPDPEGEFVQLSEVREFLGWLSGDIPELHPVEVPRLADSLERFMALDTPNG